jgi:putative DNA primase/helicase
MFEEHKLNGAGGTAPFTSKINNRMNALYSSKDNFYKKNQHEIEQECISFMVEKKFPIDKIVADDTWKRVSIDGGNDEDEWYRAFTGISSRGNPWLMCTFGTWSGGHQIFGTFKSWESDNSLSFEEKKANQEEFIQWEKKNKDRQSEEQAQKIQLAQYKWEQASEEPIDHIDHLAYLSRKKVSPHDVRYSYATFSDGTKEKPQWEKYPTLLIPLKNSKDEVQAVQHIRADGVKRIYGSKSGNFHTIGTIGSNGQIYVAEGYATAATCYEATNVPTVVAFDCGNLDAVITNLQAKYPQHIITILGDDDIETPGNPGRSKANIAAKNHGCKVFFPTFSQDFFLPANKSNKAKKPTDWNDLHVFFGIEEVLSQIQACERSKPRLVSLTYKALLQKEIRPRKFILKPWLAEAAITMVFAPPGVGKSYLCLSAAITIASGGKIFRASPWEAPEPKRVLYVDGEMHEADLQIRVKKLLTDFGGNIPNDDYLRYLNGTWQSGSIPDLSTIEGQKLVEEVIVDQGTQVLFLDNLSTLCRAGRENETDSWKQMQAWLLGLRWRGIAVVLVHHAGKGKDENGKPRQRGTSMREVVLESSIVLDHPKDYSEEMGCVFELSYIKARGFSGADAIPIEARLVEKDGILMWEDKKLSVKTYDNIVNIYNDGTTAAKEIAIEVGISVQAVRTHIRNAKTKGDIK